MRTEPESAGSRSCERKIDDLNHLAAFALPIMRTLAAWPAQATWAEWLDLFEALAPRVLLRPDRVLRVLADLRPMGAVGPVTLDEAARVLANRLSTVEAEPPARRYGRVLVGSPSQLRGRIVRRRVHPGAGGAHVSAEAARGSAAAGRGARSGSTPGCRGQADRAELEKLQLRLAVGAAESRLYVSFPDRRGRRRRGRACRRSTRSKCGAR